MMAMARVIVFNATFNNISVISWRSVFFSFSFPTFALFILQLAVSENLNGILKNSYLQGLKTNEKGKKN
jgi:hypothetical protein